MTTRGHPVGPARHEGLHYPGAMKKLLILLVLAALGTVAARKLKDV